MKFVCFVTLKFKPNLLLYGVFLSLIDKIVISIDIGINTKIETGTSKVALTLRFFEKQLFIVSIVFSKISSKKAAFKINPSF